MIFKCFWKTIFPLKSFKQISKSLWKKFLFSSKSRFFFRYLRIKRWNDFQSRHCFLLFGWKWKAYWFSGRNDWWEEEEGEKVEIIKFCCFPNKNYCGSLQLVAIMQLDGSKKLKNEKRNYVHKRKMFGVKEALVLSHSHQGFRDNAIMIRRIFCCYTYKHEQSYDCTPGRHLR